MAKTEPKQIDQIDAYLEANEGFHYNFVETPKYKISTGSLKFDIKVGGGFGGGILRFSGCSNAGKTSETLLIAKNFQESTQIKGKRKVIYFNAEGRDLDGLVERAGVNTDKEYFRLIKSNIYDFIIGMISDLIHNNPEKVLYMFVLDSMDAIVTKEDSLKAIGEGNRVAGTAGITTDFLRKMSNPINCLGHMAILISQVRAEVKINQYAKSDPRLTNASGGNALTHYPDWILEFQQNFGKDMILEGDDKNKILGHWCKVIVRKSTNETNLETVEYPIKRKQVNGKSVWVEYELTDVLKGWDFISKKGAWFTFSKELRKELMDKKIECPEQVQGEPAIIEFLENNPEATQYLYSKFCKTLAATGKPTNEVA